MHEIIPFIINSNMIFDKESISDFDKFMYSSQFNTGNIYITYSLIKEIFGGIKPVDHIPNIFLYDYSRQDSDLDIINNKCTHVFLNFQDFIREKEFNLDYEKLTQFLNRINKPLIIAGIGANARFKYDNNLHKKLSPQLVNFLKFISSHSVKLGVRGVYTEETLHKIGINNVSVIGCPSYYEQGRERIIRKKELSDINSVVISSSFNIKGMEDNFQICQDTQEADIIKAIAFNNFEFPIQKKRYDKIIKRKYKIFSNIDEWKDFVSQFSLSVGNRVHGSIISLNAGTPAICTNSDARAREMTSLFHIPLCSEISSDVDVLKAYERFNADDINNTYLTLYDNYVKFLNENGVSLYNKKEADNTYLTLPNLPLYSNFDNESFMNKVSSDFIIYDIKYRTENIEYMLLKLSEKFSKPTFMQRIFSVKNEYDYKILRLLGFKIKLWRKL